MRWIVVEKREKMGEVGVKRVSMGDVLSNMYLWVGCFIIIVVTK